MDRQVNLTAAAVFAGTLLLHVAILSLAGAWRGPVRVDEVHKVSETVFLRLAIAARWSDEEWFCSRVERSNPPAGKYMLGLAILASGHSLPVTPSLSSALSADGWVPPVFDAQITEPWLPLIAALRRFSGLLTAATGAMVATVVFSRLGLFAAGVSWIAFVSSWLSGVYGTAATFEPVLTFFMVAALLFASLNRSWTPAVAGVCSGLALATRLSGAVALIGALVLLLARKGLSWRTRAKLTGTVGGLALLTAVVIDPFLWARLPASDCVPDTLRQTEITAIRPLTRMKHRMDDLTALSSMLRSRGIDLSLAERPPFVIEQVGGDPAGLILLTLSTLGLLLLPYAMRGRALAFAAASILVIYVVWLPFPWPRYIFPIVPSMAILAAWGIVAAVDALRSRRAGVSSTSGE